MGRLLGTWNGPYRHLDDPVRIAFDGGFRKDALDLSGAHVLTEARQLRGFDSVAEMRRRLARRDGFLRRADDPLGDGAFHVALHDYLMTDNLLETPRSATATTAGGRGAIGLALEMLRRLHPETTIWLPDQGRRWQADMVRRAELNLRFYPYSDGSTLLRERMLQVLEAAAPGDVLLLQACGHDPTGLDLTEELWAALTALCIETGTVPLIDLAYAGLAAGPEKDVDGLQGMLMAVPEAFLAVSCSWSFALHGDRTGMLLVQAETPSEAEEAQALMAELNAAAIGAPPRGGELIVTDLLFSIELRAGWEAEARKLRMSLGETRARLADALAGATGEDRWGALATGRGLHAQLPLAGPRRLRMWTGHGIMIAEDGRINLSGLDAAAIDRIAAAVADCLAAAEEELESGGETGIPELDALLVEEPLPEDEAAPESGADGAPEPEAKRGFRLRPRWLPGFRGGRKKSA
ncbi:aminotransferase class I/II-fold pyridoxal phosphate-dependent enzyme [Mangrovicoccus sp. HB161399]|uniref:aminotransferase class I/II-fold pyridoxal phosphate-dependent enzyme n=1 Tax=Mangrovicoccus sp. HB161399 TaxID=2720392 RepID=UPI001C131E29|nr:aminotransferase class I/II-fold pyridoxal phosphate-dependent enzyme [Mangrovicoccus sp. HB161399]